MGKLVYGSPSMELEFDDRTLSHLQVVIGSKLRRGESFFFSWIPDNAESDETEQDARKTMWLSPGVPLMFTFAGELAPQLNTKWLHALEETANTGRGLLLVPEPTDDRTDAGSQARKQPSPARTVRER